MLNTYVNHLYPVIFLLVISWGGGGFLNWTSSSVSITSEVETFSTGEGGVELTCLLLYIF